MKLLNFFSLIYVTISVVFISFGAPNNLQKKIAKEIKIAFEVESYILDEIIVSSEINAKLKSKVKENSLFKIIVNTELKGYAFVDKAPSKTDEFDFLILFDSNFVIKKTKILVYREDYGGEIASRRWLKQFIGKNENDMLIYGKDIIGISGATISANSMTIAVNNVLQIIEQLRRNKVI